MQRAFITYEDRLMYREFIPYDTLLLSVLEYCDMELNITIFAKEWETIKTLHKHFGPYADVVQTLAYLKKQHCELIIMSNTSHECINHHLEKMGNLFDDVLLSDDTKCYKPTIKFFKDAEQKYHLSTKEHWHIAKGYWWDIVPCATLGWKKIWVNRNGKTGMQRHLPYEEIPGLSGLITLFPSI